MLCILLKQKLMAINRLILAVAHLAGYLSVIFIGVAPLPQWLA